MDLPFDISAITPIQLLILTASIALVDFVFAVVDALRPSTGTTFSWSIVANVLETHILKRVLPIYALAFLSFGVPGEGHVYIFGLAIGGVGIYLGETVVSVSASIHSGPAAKPATAAPAG